MTGKSYCAPVTEFMGLFTIDAPRVEKCSKRHAAIVTGNKSREVWTARYTVQSEDEGCTGYVPVGFKISFVDLAGNNGLDVTKNSGSEQRKFPALFIDTVAPTLSEVSIHSNNIDQSRVTLGNQIELNIVASEPLRRIRVRMMQACTLDGDRLERENASDVEASLANGNGDRINWSGTYQVSYADVGCAGQFVGFVVTFEDLAGNIGSVNSTTDNSRIAFEHTVCPFGHTYNGQRPLVHSYCACSNGGLDKKGADMYINGTQELHGRFCNVHHFTVTSDATLEVQGSLEVSAAFVRIDGKLRSTAAGTVPGGLGGSPAGEGVCADWNVGGGGGGSASSAGSAGGMYADSCGDNADCAKQISACTGGAGGNAHAAAVPFGAAGGAGYSACILAQEGDGQFSQCTDSDFAQDGTKLCLQPGNMTTDTTPRVYAHRVPAVSPHSCRIECEITPGCAYFVFNMNQHSDTPNCCLKKSSDCDTDNLVATPAEQPRVYSKSCSGSTTDRAEGGAGGGYIHISGHSVRGNGTIMANGKNGQDGQDGGGGGGGGGGGLVLIEYNRLSADIALATIQAISGMGGKQTDGNADGGQGAEGSAVLRQVGWCAANTVTNPVYCTHDRVSMAHDYGQCVDGTALGEAPTCYDGSMACCCDPDGRCDEDDQWCCPAAPTACGCEEIGSDGKPSNFCDHIQTPHSLGVCQACDGGMTCSELDLPKVGMNACVSRCEDDVVSVAVAAYKTVVSDASVDEACVGDQGFKLLGYTDTVTKCATQTFVEASCSESFVFGYIKLA